MALKAEGCGLGSIEGQKATIVLPLTMKEGFWGQRVGWLRETGVSLLKSLQEEYSLEGTSILAKETLVAIQPTELWDKTTESSMVCKESNRKLTHVCYPLCSCIPMRVIFKDAHGKSKHSHVNPSLSYLHEQQSGLANGYIGVERNGIS